MKKKGARKRKKVRRTGGSSSSQLQHRLRQSASEFLESGSEAEDDWAELWTEDAASPRRGEGKKAGTSKAGAPKTTTRDAAEQKSVDSALATNDATGASGRASVQRIEGQVVSIASGLCWLETSSGERILCVLSSDIARDQRSALAVGDRASALPTSGDEPRLEEVFERRTWLSRPDPLNPRQQRVVAANMDIVVQTSSLVAPALRPALIDRYLIAIEQGHATPLICINKIDGVDAAELERQLQPLDVYRQMGIEIVCCSAQDGTGIEELRAKLVGKTAVFVGHSGVGKSSLINALDSSVEAEIGEVSSAHGTGRHTTTRSNLYELSAGIRLIDTPGIRELGLWQLDRETLRDYFPDFQEAASRCRFTDCSHSHEPDCQVQAAVAAGIVDRARFATYQRLLNSLESD